MVVTFGVILGFKILTTTENRVVGKFNTLKVNGAIQVFLVKGLGDTVRIKADKNLSSKISTEVINNELIIRPLIDIKNERVLQVYVSSENLEMINIQGASTAEVVDKIKRDTLRLSLDQSAEARVLAECNFIELMLNGSSNIFMAGKVNTLAMKLNGVSDVVAYKLESKNCDISINAPKQSEGIFRVSVSDTLRVTMAPPYSRMVYYRGDPIIVANKEIMSRIKKK